MRERLAESLRYVGRCAASHLTTPAGLEAALDRIVRGPVSPLLFGAYYELVIAIEDDDLEAAARRLDEIVGFEDAPVTLRVVDLADPARDAGAARLVRLVDTDPEISFEMRPPSAQASARCRQHLDAGLALMEQGAPELAAEIRALLREVVLAVGPDDPGAPDFDGASSFMLWGAVVLNADAPRSRLDAVQALAHESGHNLLFGFATDGPLVENDDDERHASPLRPDPRPMDGIFHATFVSARVHWALRRLLDGDALRADERDAARSEVEASAKCFEQGIATLDRHAQLSPAGAAAIAPARSWMRSAG